MAAAADKDPPADREGRPRFFSPTLFLAYGWAYAFTVFSAVLGLHALALRHPWPEWAAWPLVVMGYGAIFAILIGLRPVFLDLAADLGVREKFGIVLLHALIFVAPRLMSPRATLIDCLMALQVPLAMLLLRRTNFMRLYLVNFLLAALAIFILWRTDGGGFVAAACLPLFLCGCFAADHFFFEIERYARIEARPVWRPIARTFRYAFVTLGGGGILYSITPKFSLASQDRIDRSVVGQSGGGQTVSTDALVELVWDTFLLLVLLVVTLAALQYVKRRFRRREGAQTADLGTGVMKMVRKVLQSRPAPPETKRGFSPREQILRGYWSWCDEMARLGLGRTEDMTPKEYAGLVARYEGQTAEQLGGITRLFEKAKYDRREIARGEAESFFDLTRRALDILLETTRARG